MKWKEVAKFFSGVEAFHAVFHAYLLASGTTFTAFGVTASPTWGIVGVVLNGTLALVLGLYGWRGRSGGEREVERDRGARR